MRNHSETPDDGRSDSRNLPPDHILNPDISFSAVRGPKNPEGGSNPQPKRRGPPSKGKRVKSERRQSQSVSRFPRVGSSRVALPPNQKVHERTPLIERLLALKGLHSAESQQEFLNPTLERDLPDLDQLKGMDETTKMITQAVRSGKKIAICCDYDVDGITSAAIMARTLEAVGAEFEIFAPDRFRDGYGLNKKMVAGIAEQGFDLLLTLDFGTSNGEELALAKKLGLDTIVVDHHKVISDLPPCSALINPQQSGCNYADGTLCTAGLAYCLSESLKTTWLRPDSGFDSSLVNKIDSRETLAFAALGTVADIVPLRGANRAIVAEGLKQLTLTENPGIQALLQVCGIQGQVTSHHVGFQLGPRINAAGRMIRAAEGEAAGAMLPLTLLLTEDQNRAKLLAAELQTLNNDRKQRLRGVVRNCIRQIERKRNLSDVIVVQVRGKDLGGVLGIAASRLVDIYQRPVVVLTRTKEGMVGGSARSIPGINITDLIGDTAVVSKYGGHSGATGLELAIGDLPIFETRLRKLGAQAMKGRPRYAPVRGDVETDFAELTLQREQLLRDLSRIEPCGAANRAPRFTCRNVEVVSVSKNSQRSFLSVKLRQGGNYLTAYLWQSTFHPALKVGNTIDLVATAHQDSKTQFHQHSKLQLHLVAAQRSDLSSRNELPTPDEAAH